MNGICRGCSEKMKPQAIALHLEKSAHMHRQSELSESIQELDSQLLSLRSVMLEYNLHLNKERKWLLDNLDCWYAILIGS